MSKTANTARGGSGPPGYGPLQICFIPRTPAHHTLSVLRSDGTSDEALLETRSYLLHDLAHLAVESEARLTFGVWGTIAAGASLSELRMAAEVEGIPGGRDELWIAERLVGPLQAVWNGRYDSREYLGLVVGLTPNIDEGFPARALARLRALWGHWKATRHGQIMRVRWEGFP